MKKFGILLLIIGAASLFIVVLPNSVFYALNFGQNLIRFFNNFLIIVAIFTLSGGWAMVVAGKKRLHKNGDVF